MSRPKVLCVLAASLVIAPLATSCSAPMFGGHDTGEIVEAWNEGGSETITNVVLECDSPVQRLTFDLSIEPSAYSLAWLFVRTADSDEANLDNREYNLNDGGVQDSVSVSNIPGGQEVIAETLVAGIMTDETEKYGVRISPSC